MAALYREPSGASDSPTLEPTQLSEGGYVINTLLLLSYNYSSLPEPLPPKNAEDRLELLHAAEKYKFTGRAVNAFLVGHLETLEPLQAWALAVRFNLREASMNACKRIIEEDVNITALADDVQELDAVSDRMLMRLQSIQKATFSAAYSSPASS
ncbi:hypothetical protein DL93DRAFT_2234079 [Clavulina sp. PMI_390]|nr:hypothetical protein DL93DRAFT_2234079 [Clavulina sp. PMI_390]